MQVFLPYPINLTLSARSLDDLRLNKQITEINQILLTYINNRGGYSEHPINKWYKNKNGIIFLLDYLQELSTEYTKRFEKVHMGELTRMGICLVIGSLDVKENKSFLPVYIKGQRGKNQVITTENVGLLYRKLLCEKWDNDEKKPVWTNREIPSFYKGEKI